MTQPPRISRANDSIESSGRFIHNTYTVIEIPPPSYCLSLICETRMSADRTRVEISIILVTAERNEFRTCVLYTREVTSALTYTTVIPNVVASTWAIHPFGDGLSYSFANNIRRPSPPRDVRRDV